MPDAHVTISEEQALFFRARRSHLAGPGAADPTAAARAIVGAQAQQLNPALLALSLRTRKRPTQASLAAHLHAEGRDLVRAWGQRGTLHVYDAAEHWADIIAVRPALVPAGRRGVMPNERELAAAKKRIFRLKRASTRSDLLPNVPARLVREAAEMLGKGKPAERLAAGRMFWVLALRGEMCVARKEGSEQSYAPRALWFPKLPWPRKLDARTSGERLTRRYLAANAPATVQDIAHFFGSKVGDARDWIAPIAEAGELIDVTCGERKGLLALRADAKELSRAAPKAEKDWPTRLLPLWDCHLMGHADKSWTVPEASERTEVWRKAAMIPGTVLSRGRVVATWSHDARAKHVTVEVTPLSGWRKTKHEKPVRAEAKALARHLELDRAEVEIAG